ncbi:hypothetical protein ACFV2Q_38415 [Streptomyces sp. NPDC059650]|uniref:hypothetical protein n=1 Tax=Streptomyces sp. NPDC059650 TaxID=3346896 RepID=UPI0036B7B3A4
MSDHYQDVDTRADAAAEAALDAILAGHQEGLHTALACALNTEAGLAQLGHRPTLSRFRPRADLAPQILVVHKVNTSLRPASSALASAVDALEEELGEVEASLTAIEGHPNLKVTPPGTRTSPQVALMLVRRELARITGLLVFQEITKESAGTEFDEAEKILEDQVAGWTEKLAQAPRTRHAEMLDLFINRADATMLLRKLIVRLFEDADETVLQLN